LAGVAVGLGAGIVWYLWPVLGAPSSFLGPGVCGFSGGGEFRGFAVEVGAFVAGTA